MKKLLSLFLVPFMTSLTAGAANPSESPWLYPVTGSMTAIPSSPSDLSAWSSDGIFLPDSAVPMSGSAILLSHTKNNRNTSCDLVLVDNFGPRIVYQADHIAVGVIVENQGKSDVCSFTVNYCIDGTMNYSHTFTDIQLSSDDGPTCFMLPDSLPVNGLGAHEVTLSLAGSSEVHTDENAFTYTVTNKECEELPYLIDFECGHQEIITEDSNPDTPDNLSWKYSQDATGNWTMSCISPDYNTPHADDWVFMPPVWVEPGLYKLSYDVDSPKANECCEIWSGSGRSAAEMTEYICDINHHTPDGPENNSLVVEIREPQLLHLGFHLVTYYNRSIRLDNITFGPHTPGPAEVKLTSIGVAYGDYVAANDPNTCTAFIEMSNPTIDRPLKEIDYEVFVDGKSIASGTIPRLRSKAGNHIQFHLPAGEFVPGDHILSARIDHPDDTDPDNNYLEVPIRIIGGTPFFTYDFEDGQFPEGSQTLCLDEGVMTDNPENPAWYVDTIVDRNGESVTALFSSADLQKGVAADRWFILPPLNLLSYPSDLVWYAASLNTENADPFEHATYDVLISETGTDPSDFTLVDTYVAGLWPDIKRLKLDDYGGKQIYIAFRYHSDCGYKIYIDDLTHYDSFREGESDTGILSLTGTASAVRLVGNQLQCSDPVDRLEVIGLNGCVLASVQGAATLPVPHLPAGVYLVRIYQAGHVTTAKFIR